MKICTIIGARPEFIQSAPVSHALMASGWREVIVHTGQHYDHAMSGIFFEELQINRPTHNLGVGPASHGVQTGRMLIRLEAVLRAEQPDLILVYGDTNSTLAGALVATKLHIPVAHVEAGLRSFNRAMPEEHNRVLTDHIADLLFCPTRTAVRNLAAEGITRGVHEVGDVMCDMFLLTNQLAEEKVSPLEDLGLSPQSYYLVTLHRPYNVDLPGILANILSAFALLGSPVVFPAHPRTRKLIRKRKIALAPNIRLIEPVGYLEMLVLEKYARVVLTDSGGIQKETYLNSVPCVTIRPETEWVETVETGWNTLAHPTSESILSAVNKPYPPHMHPPLFGDGQAAQRIVSCIGAWKRPAASSPRGI